MSQRLNQDSDIVSHIKGTYTLVVNSSILDEYQQGACTMQYMQACS